MTPAMRRITDEEACEMLDWFEDAFGQQAAPDDELPTDNRRIAHAIEFCYDGGLAQWFKDAVPTETTGLDPKGELDPKGGPWVNRDDYDQSRADEERYNWDIETL